MRPRSQVLTRELAQAPGFEPAKDTTKQGITFRIEVKL